MLLYLELEPYIADWFINQHGGERPVKLLKGSVESNILEVFLTTPPADYVPEFSGEGKVAVIIPSFRSKDTRYHFFLPTSAMNLLVSTIKVNFDICLWTTLHRFSNVGCKKEDLIYAFMEKFGIAQTATNYYAVEKRYQRKKDTYAKNEKRKSQKIL